MRVSDEITEPGITDLVLLLDDPRSCLERDPRRDPSFALTRSFLDTDGNEACECDKLTVSELAFPELVPALVVVVTTWAGMKVDVVLIDDRPNTGRRVTADEMSILIRDGMLAIFEL